MNYFTAAVLALMGVSGILGLNGLIEFQTVFIVLIGALVTYLIVDTLND